MLRHRPVVLFLFSILILSLRAAIAGEKIYVSSSVFTYLQEIDIETGDRRFIYLDDWPRILAVGDYAVDSDGTILIETYDALMRRGIYRFDPSTGTKTPVSGGVNGLTDLLGAGPEIRPSINTLVLGPESLFALRPSNGPMEIDLATGDRRIVSQSDRQTTDTIPSEIPMYSPQDMAMLNAENLLVADRFDGYLMVNIEHGKRSRLLAPELAIYTGARIDRLDDGRVVLTLAEPDTPTIFVVDLNAGTQAIHSGSFGGQTRGSGPEFELPADLMVDSKGRLWVYDTVIPAIFRVDPDGTRTIVSSAQVGGGDELADYTSRPLMGTYRRPLPTGKPSTGWIVF